MRGRAAAFLVGPCGPKEVAAEKVMSLVQNGVKRVVDRAGGAKEVPCLDLSPCRRNTQVSSSGTEAWAQEELPAPLPAALLPLFPSIFGDIGSDNFSKAFRNM